jgi:uncharacterized protein (TIGR02145 family)
MKTVQIITTGVLGILMLVTFQSCGSDDDSKTPSNTFTDARDGNVYRTVTIGDQVWMAENLRYLPSVVSPAVGSITTPYYYVNNYNGTAVNDAKAVANYSTYGVLYNWPAAMNEEPSSTSNPSDVQGVCPEGWHLPSINEWLELGQTIGGFGGNLKETGTDHWLLPNTGATDAFGFTALPGGVRLTGNGFQSPGEMGWWWTTSQAFDDNANLLRLFYNDGNIMGFNDSKSLGLSVRCVKD